MKCLSFLGTGQLRDTRYRYQDKVCQTPVVQEAIASFFPIDEIVLFTTKKAEETNYRQVLSRCPTAKKIPVPDGQSEDELWMIFSQVAGEVNEGDTIIFDITHGFRSLPFIALLSAAYLQEAKEARLAGIVYGAFEAGDGTETPLFDLSGFLQIFEWMAGVKSFVTHGDAREIKTLIQKIAGERFQSSGGKVGPTHIGSFASKLEEFTSSVRLSLPVEGIAHARSIVGALPGAEEEIGTYTPALKPLIKKIATIERFSAAAPDENTGPCNDHLFKQLELIKHQVERGLYPQAAMLAREWMVSVLLCAAGDGGQWLNKKVRENAERTLSGGVMKTQNTWYERTIYSDWFESLPCWKDCAKIWDQITSIRNDIAHCGMNKQGSKPSRIESRIQELTQNLDKFAQYLLFDNRNV